MRQTRKKELDAIIRKIQDNPGVLKKVNAAIDKMFADLGFKLTPEEKTYIFKKLISKQKREDIIVCAGTGARCCRY
ncbi:MAG: hypothetical protein PHV17_06530 [Candidatus Omnitrophica bacterium]|jgi:hypothetical protein|nr:RNA-dependent RNA-polymerase [Candidatus Omnitrophota bacterium]MDD5070368.1 hypothetical protein [Candidatus Omnitrophota bacterium]